jgi:hypothetical protein
MGGPVHYEKEHIMAKADQKATPEDIERLKQTIKETNEDRRKDKLRRQVNRAHDWRVQVWAQSELKIREANAALQALGDEPIKPFDPDFTDDSNLHHYSTMTLTK